MLILRPVVHEEEQPRRREALDQPIEQRLGFRVDPVKILEDQQKWLDLALADQELLERVERPLATLPGSSPCQDGIASREIEQGEERRQTASWARSSVRSFPVSFSRTARGPSRSSMAKYSLRRSTTGR